MRVERTIFSAAHSAYFLLRNKSGDLESFLDLNKGGCECDSLVQCEALLYDGQRVEQTPAANTHWPQPHDVATYKWDSVHVDTAVL